MYSTIPHLQAAVRTALQKGELCRIYRETLDACWPGLAEPVQRQRIEEFAARNHWAVTYRVIGALGLVAEFTRLMS